MNAGDWPIGKQGGPCSLGRVPFGFRGFVEGTPITPVILAPISHFPPRVLLVDVLFGRNANAPQLVDICTAAGPAHSAGCHRPVVSTEFAGPVDSGRNTHIFWSPAHTLSPQPASFVTMTTTNQTTPKKHKNAAELRSQGAREATPRHPGRRQRRQLSRKHHHRRAQTRRRSGHGQIRPPNRHRRRRRRGRPLLLLSPWPFSLQQMSFEGLARICGGEQPPIPAAKMTFVLFLGRNGKTSSLLLSSRPPTCCVPSPSVEESMSYSTTRKNGRTCMQQHLKEHCSLKLHLSTHRPRGKTRDAGRFVFLCSQVA